MTVKEVPGHQIIPSQGPGARAMQAFSDTFGATSLQHAMTLACERLRTRVQAAGWEAGLPAYLRAFGLRVLEAPISQAGRLDYEDGRYVIRIKPEMGQASTEHEVNPNRVRGRQRFSIAHELGHALLMEALGNRKDLLVALRDPDAWEQIERLCDQAAADLLIPIESFFASTTRHGFAPGSVQAIAREYSVSREVVIRRLINAGARAVVLWRVRYVPGKGLRATVRESFTSPNGPRFWIGDDSGCLRPNLVHRAARSGQARSSQLRLRRGVATWSLAGIAAATQPLIDGQRSSEAEVALLLLHESAVADRHPFWSASAKRVWPIPDHQ